MQGRKCIPVLSFQPTLIFLNNLFYLVIINYKVIHEWVPEKQYFNTNHFTSALPLPLTSLPLTGGFFCLTWALCFIVVIDNTLILFSSSFFFLHHCHLHSLGTFKSILS